MKKVLGLVALATGLLMAWVAVCYVTVGNAYAHDWYIGQQNPVGWSCCYGPNHAQRDCANIIFGAGQVDETSEGYIVTLTKAQMLIIRPSLLDNADFKAIQGGIREFIPYKDAQPASDGSYSACLSAAPVSWRPGEPKKWVRCFFYPSNS